MTRRRETPSQTAGPYLHIGLLPGWADDGRGPARLGAPAGGPVPLTLRILDGAGAPLRDALVEIWEPAPRWTRHAAHPETGEVRHTGTAAPFWSVWIAARGINLGLHTRICFDPAAAAFAGGRAATLIPVRHEGGWRHDIHLQGPNETVFVAI
ncbi:MAG: hypothetical protein ACU0CO_06285 [Shimia sp.]